MTAFSEYKPGTFCWIDLGTTVRQDPFDVHSHGRMTVIQDPRSTFC